MTEQVVFALSFAAGVGLFFAIRIAVEEIIWRLRGRPVCGFRWPMNWRNLVDDGWRKYKMDNGKTGWYYEKPRWRP